MLTKLNHPKYRGIELVGESLIIHPMQGESKRLQDGVKDFAVAVENEEIQIIAFLDRDYAWFYQGKSELNQTRVELGQKYGGGGKLIFDGGGSSHLFYFVEQSLGHSVLLRHQIFREKWSTPVMVSTNVFARGQSYSVAWHGDNYIHIAYCNHREQHLLYRIFDGEHGIWSGAVPFSQKRCSSPQLISGEKLYLFWLEEIEGGTNLKVKTKEQTWSAPISITESKNTANVGFAQTMGSWQVLWSEANEVHRVFFDAWSEVQKTTREDYSYAVLAQASGVLAMYHSKVEDVPREDTIAQKRMQVASVSVEEQVREEKQQARQEQQEKQEKQEKQDRQVQAAFVEQAFRTLQEWENFREEIKSWQARITIPEPVDLDPLVKRLDRLERRIFTLQQGQEKQTETRDTNLKKLEMDVGRIQQRMMRLEENIAHSKQPSSLWRRFLTRF